MRNCKRDSLYPVCKDFFPHQSPHIFSPGPFSVSKRQSVAQIPRVVLSIIQQSPMALHFTVAATLQSKYTRKSC